MIKSIEMKLISHQPLGEKETGKSLLKIMCEVAPQLVPDKYGNWEPANNKFNQRDIDTAIALWNAPSFLWKRKQPKSEGCVFINDPKYPKIEYGSIDIYSYSIDFVFKDMKELFFAWCLVVKPDFGCLHVLNEIEVQRGMKAKVVSLVDRIKNTYTLLISVYELKKYLPDLYWATVFGPMYISYFGRDKLLSAPAFQVREIGSDNIYLQLSADINDLENKPEEIAQARKAIKKHLGENSFFDPALGRDYQYSTPWSDSKLEK